MNYLRHQFARGIAVLLLTGIAPFSPPSARADTPPAGHKDAHSNADAQDDHAATPSLATPPDALSSTNLVKPPTKAKPVAAAVNYQHQIDVARQLRRSKDYAGAEKMLVTLLENQMPPEFKRMALFELALLAQDSGKLSRAQQILAQYTQAFPQDPTMPEVLLRQGLIYRQMGAHNMAVAKFYAVMNTALGLKLDQFDYYKRLVLQAQTEIADTHYIQGKYAEAADFFGRIIKQSTTDLNRPQVHFKLIRCLINLDRHPEAVTQAQAFLEKHPDAPEVPELRFLYATSLKQLGRTQEALAQVIKLIESQQDSAATNPENWTYWQQRTGNEIANQLYMEGDYLNALQVYNHLAGLNTSAEWQLPVWYQTGLIYERLYQPQKAVEKYTAIISREKETSGPGIAPSLKTVVEMAKWRKDQISWHEQAGAAVQSLRLKPVLASSTTNSPTIKEKP